MAEWADQLERGRESYASRAWGDAFDALARVDRAAALEPADLERLATAAFMLGRFDDFGDALDRAHRQYLAAGETLRAARCAFWVGANLAFQGAASPASGWFNRARRLVERFGGACVEQGYLLLPVVQQHIESGDWAAAAATAGEAAATAERFGDRDLFALAVHEQGHALVRQGRAAEGLGLLDEAMVAATTGELSPIVTGLIYCGVIDYCQQLYEFDRAQQWTATLTRWCEQQPELVTYTGQCLVHRAEIMQLGGAWSDALKEARLAAERLMAGRREGVAGDALYRQGEIHRLRGEFTAAEEAYRQASRYGCEPQPGLALLRLAQGNTEAALSAINRAAAESTEPLHRARLLPAAGEIMLAVGDVEAAREACRGLAAIAERHRTVMLEALTARACGAVALAEGDAPAALVALRRAWQLWEELEAPYESARARVLLGLGCRALGDEEAAKLELEAARATFQRMGAAPDVARVSSLVGGEPPGRLTPRELEVLRLVAGGSTNKAVATELVLSERTVERHLSNIFAKLSVPSRSAATAWAYEHNLV